MSDDGKSGGGYKFEYAPNARAACKGPKPCKGTKLSKGELRFGSVADFRGHPSWSYRHYGCITKKVFTNLKSKFGSVDEVEGFSELKDEDKEKVKAAWEAGEVAAEDVPATANAGADEDDAAPKKAARPRKKKKTDDDDEDDEPKPKRKAGRPRKKKVASDDEADLTASEDDAGSDYGAGKKRKRGGAKKSPAKKAKADDDEAEDQEAADEE